MRLPLLLICLVFLCLLAGCLENSNVPGVTRDPEESAKTAYPDLPDSSQAVELIERGEKLFRGLTCEQCHSTGSERNGLMGPPLGGLSDRIIEQEDNDPLEARRWTLKHIKDPAKYPSKFAGQDDYRGAHMTPFPRITDEDLRALVEYLFSLR